MVNIHSYAFLKFDTIFKRIQILSSSNAIGPNYCMLHKIVQWLRGADELWENLSTWIYNNRM